MYKVEDLYRPLRVRGAREWLVGQRRTARAGLALDEYSSVYNSALTPLGLAAFSMAGVNVNTALVRIPIKLEFQLLAAEPEELV